MIKHIRIVNFKSLGDVSVDLDPVTVLIGQSGTGKSNFVEAIRFFRDYLRFGNDTFLADRGGWQGILPATATKPVTLSIGLRFDVPGIREEYEYWLRFEQPQQGPSAPPQFKEEGLKLGGRGLFHQSQGEWIQPPKVVSPPRAGSLVLGSLTGLPEVSRAHLVLSTGIGCYAFPDTVLLGPGSIQGTEQTGLADSGENFIQAFGAIVNNLQAWQYPLEIVAALRRLTASLKSVDLEMPQKNRIALSHDLEGNALVFRLHQQSEGFRRLLAHLIALYQSPPKQTLVFEEPEKGIHPGVLAVLAEEFLTCPSQGRGQVILTTHSPELLNRFEPEMLRVVEIQNYVTRIGPLVQDQLSSVREKLLQPGELLTVDPARLVTVGEPAG
jgi:predicted ATPase